MASSPPALAGDRTVARPFSYWPMAASAVADLGPFECRWPLGEPADADFAFCGAVRLSRGSYCAVHARLARAGSSGREARR